ncbi:MAG: type II toxin-antitoxin system HicB family antitoxin [Chloroflexota bacterium]
MMNYRIRLVLEPNPGGVFTVTSPDVPGLVTEGSTAAEIQANVQDALEALFEAWAELDKPIPSAPDWGSKDLAPGTVRAIIRQLGISREEFGPIK